MELKKLENKRIGYWLTEKKCRVLNIEKLKEKCKNLGIHLEKLDLRKSLEEQGPFDLIFHKVTDLLTKCPLSNSEFQNFISYIRSHPDIIIVDNVEHVLRVFDRDKLNELLIRCNLFNGENFKLPTSLLLKNVHEAAQILKQHHIRFPIICKPIEASHKSQVKSQMSIVFRIEDLHEVIFPCIAQHFYNHHGVLWKVFVVGDEVHITQRSSIGDLQQGDNPVIHFQSNQVSKTYCTSPFDCGDAMVEEETFVGLSELCQGLRKVLGLDLFGFDVIRAYYTPDDALFMNNTANSTIPMVIDVNPFPSYDGVPDFPSSIINLIQHKLP